MKCFLLLIFVAFSWALPYYGGSKSINIGEDGTIVITGANGKRVTISKAVGGTDDKYIDISVEGPNLPPKRIRIDEQGADKTVSVQNGPYSGQYNGLYWEDELREKRSPKVATTKDTKKSKTQADLLYSIFKEYEGVVDEKSYESLLKKVDQYVETGDLDSSVSDVLKYMHDQKVAEEQVTENGVQPAGVNKAPIVHSDISGIVRDYIWANKYAQPDWYGQSTVGPQDGQWIWQQQSGWIPSQQQQWVPPQQQSWVSPQQQSWVPTQQQTWVPPQQQKWVSPQQQPWIPPQQQQWVTPQQQQWVTPQQQQWVTPQQQQWVPPQQQPWGSQPQQWLPQQQSVPVQQSPVQQKPTYNPWIAYYLGQMWNQQRSTLGQQYTAPVKA